MNKNVIVTCAITGAGEITKKGYDWYENGLSNLGI
ncbi:hypothetical protein IIM_04902 [Bacillus cereus VD107]|nr:hypothetical protein IIM_04902 [Bacillus cereus VD107]